MKLFVIAGHSKKSPGALAYNGVYEHHYTSEAQRLLAQKHTIIQMEGSVILDQEDLILSEVIRYINGNARPEDYGIDIHFNNNNPRASGSEGFVSPYTTRTNRVIASTIITEGAKILNIPVRRWIPQRDYKYPTESHLGKLAIIEQTKIPFFLYEPCFLNDRDLPKYESMKRKIWWMVIETYKERFKRF